jgi:TetR/AcrR family transcriptional regulator, transcriptional repressor for nem operon
MESRTPARAGRLRQPRITERRIRKQETHERILQAAAAIARREGLQAASIPRVMRAAGLTVGGFYGHFASKRALDVEVIRRVAGAMPGRSLGGLQHLSGLSWIEKATARYLTAAHRDNPDGCSFPSILSGIATGPTDVKAAFADALDLRVNAFEANMPALPGVTPRERALALMALTIGGLLLARASTGAPVSGEMLAACQKWALPEFYTRARASREATREKTTDQ